MSHRRTRVVAAFDAWVVGGARLLRGAALGAVVGVISGCASALFLVALDAVTDLRLEQPWLLFLLPLSGLLVGLAYHHLGGRSDQGNNLILDEIHEPSAWIPRRMAPLVLLGTLATHLCGGSAGREGTAIQMAGSLSDGAARVVRLRPDDRRLVLVAALAGGFGSVFGVPLAGAVFAMEVQTIGRVRYDAIVPALTASIVGDQVVRAWGVEHAATPTIAAVDLGLGLVAKICLAGVLFGLTSAVFAEMVHGCKHLLADRLGWPPLRPVLGGLAVIALVGVVGTRDYLGLSLPLAEQALRAPAEIVLWAFALKLLFTVATLGSGFQGGEVTPLFVIGATLGAALSQVLDVPGPLLPALGFVAVFAGATNTPLACTIMGVELFGPGPLVPLAMACVLAFVASTDRGIYVSQRLAVPSRDESGASASTLGAIAARRRARRSDALRSRRPGP